MYAKKKPPHLYLLVKCLLLLSEYDHTQNVPIRYSKHPILKYNKIRSGILKY